MEDRATGQAALVELIRQALVDLHDQTLLQTSSLRALFSSGSSPVPTADLQRALLEAISQTRPASQNPQATIQWRRFRYLWLRYVEGADLREIAQVLGITDRQARRDHHEALENLAAVLWSRFRGASWPSEQAALGAGFASSFASPVGGEQDDALAAELARAAAEVPKGPTSLPDVLLSVLDISTPLVKGRKISIETSLAPSLPLVAVNRVVLRQVLMSLIAHVVSDLEDGEIRLVTGNDSRTVTLMIYTVLRHARSTESQEQGATEETPLALAQRMLTREGGSLEVRGDDGGRREIALHLPIAQLATVLVVDDNPDFLRLCQRYLEGSPYRVIAAPIATDALRLARETIPDAILLDVLMPTQDGWELLTALKNDKTTHSIPVIVCSVLREPSLALGLGADGFLPKPITLLSLLAALENPRKGPVGPGPLADNP